MRLVRLAACASCLWPALALGQVMPGQPRPGGGLPPPGGEEKEEGPAEQAPEEPEKEQSLQPLPGFTAQRQKRLQFFELSGYSRFRTEFWHNLALGFRDNGQGTPFQVPADCYETTDSLTQRNEVNRACDDNLSTANMRFRLEPTINVSETIRLHAQIDFLDNLVLGSTPEGYLAGSSGIPGATNPPPPPSNLPIPGFNRTQVPPQAGRNSTIDSVQVKRAWAEVRTPLGQLSFGRMPSHWGLGLFVNAGDCTWTPDCLDSDYGTNADRLMFATELSGIRMIGIFDWAATGPTSDRLAIGINQFQGEPFDVTNRDDVSQYGLVVGRIDKPDEWKEKVARNDVVWNLGTYIIYRSQDLDQQFNMPVPLGGTPTQVGNTLYKRAASAYVIDVWGRLHVRHLLVEGEGTFIAGSIGGVKDLPGMNEPLDIRQGGGVGRLIYSALHDSIQLKFEAGFASGDQAESLLPGQTNYMFTPVVQPPGDHTITNFHFDPDYHVDQILFRRLLGTVTNAIYAKPSFVWTPGGSGGLEAPFLTELAVVQSFAHVPVSTPGNARAYGLEVDATLAYRSDDGFNAGFIYGVLFPMGALDQPTGGTIGGEVGSTGLFPTNNGSLSVAQVIRMYLAVKF
jgi:uncharacterized protein (TIGR04551 family)